MELAHLDLIESAGDGIFLLDTEENLVLINRRLATISGYTTKEVQGRPFQILLAPRWVQCASEALACLLREESPLRLELEILDRQDRAIPVELTASLVKHGDSVSGIMGLVRETGQHKALEAQVSRYAEEARRKAEEWATIYNIGLAITLSLNPDEVLRLIYAQLAPAIPFSALAIALMGPGDQVRFEFVIQHGEPQRPFQRKLDENAGLCGWVIREARPLLIGDW